MTTVLGALLVVCGGLSFPPALVLLVGARTRSERLLAAVVAVVVGAMLLGGGVLLR